MLGKSANPSGYLAPHTCPGDLGTQPGRPRGVIFRGWGSSPERVCEVEPGSELPCLSSSPGFEIGSHVDGSAGLALSDSSCVPPRARGRCPGPPPGALLSLGAIAPFSRKADDTFWDDPKASVVSGIISFMNIQFMFPTVFFHHAFSGQGLEPKVSGLIRCSHEPQAGQPAGIPCHGLSYFYYQVASSSILQVSRLPSDCTR